MNLDSEYTVCNNFNTTKEPSSTAFMKCYNGDSANNFNTGLQKNTFVESKPCGQINTHMNLDSEHMVFNNFSTTKEPSVSTVLMKCYNDDSVNNLNPDLYKDTFVKPISSDESNIQHLMLQLDCDRPNEIKVRNELPNSSPHIYENVPYKYNQEAPIKIYPNIKKPPFPLPKPIIMRVNKINTIPHIKIEQYSDESAFRERKGSLQKRVTNENTEHSNERCNSELYLSMGDFRPKLNKVELERTVSDDGCRSKSLSGSYHIKGSNGCVYGSSEEIYSLNPDVYNRDVHPFIKCTKKTEDYPCFCQKKTAQNIEMVSNIRKSSSDLVYYSCENIYDSLENKEYSKQNEAKETVNQCNVVNFGVVASIKLKIMQYKQNLFK